MKRRPNWNVRPVEGGFVQRIHLGDRYAWLSFDQQMNRLPMTAQTLKAAVDKVARFASK